MSYIIIGYGNHVFKQSIVYLNLVKSSDYNEENEINDYTNIFGENCNMYYLKVKEDIMTFDELNNKINNEFIDERVKGSNNLYDKKINEFKKELKELLDIEKPPTFKNMIKKDSKPKKTNDNENNKDNKDNKDKKEEKKSSTKKKYQMIIVIMKTLKRKIARRKKIM